MLDNKLEYFKLEMTDLETKSKRLDTKTVTYVNDFTHQVNIYGRTFHLERILPIFEMCVGHPPLSAHCYHKSSGELAAKVSLAFDVGYTTSK